MLFTRLKLIGFKSFVEPTELAVEPGLTGIVGPNGCGKSNLVEALRWVMGEASARQMRGGEMDDVIFGGTTQRPARNLAEVLLAVDNADRRAPAQFNDTDELEIVRRIHRGEGSAYRINGREVRARDVQILFADAASGSHSPALISQGRIGQLISARPGDRRAILEDAAGIAGLHARRHEAELRLKAAEANLTRLADVLTTLDGQAKALTRQARQAERYRTLGDQIRKTEAIVLAAAWASAVAQRTAAGKAFAAAEAAVLDRVADAARAATIATERASDLPALRHAEVAASAEVQRLTLAIAECDSEAQRITTRTREVAASRADLARDLERERALEGDAAAAGLRLAEEAANLDRQEVLEAPRRQDLTGRVEAARAAAEAADAAVQALTQSVAGEEVRRQNLERAGAVATERETRLRAEAARAAATLATLQADPALAHDASQDAQSIADAEAKIAAVRARLDQLAAARPAAITAEGQALATLQALEADRARLNAEAKGLTAALAPVPGRAADPVLDQLRADPGLEAALAAALGEDALAPLARTGVEPLRWDTLDGGHDPALPAGVEALSHHVAAPPALARRLAQVGLAPSVTAAMVQALTPGQCLVTRAGDLYRWDGLVRLAAAPSATSTQATVRLGQRNRLDALTQEIATLAAKLPAAQADAAAAKQARTDLDAADQAAREEDRALTAALASARDAASRAASARLAAETRLTAQATAAERIAADLAEAAAERAARSAELAALPDLAERRASLLQERTALAEARARLADIRGDLDRLIRDQAARLRRAQAIATDQATWTARRGGAAARLEDLTHRRDAAEAEATTLAARPAVLATERAALVAAADAAGTRRTAAAQALAAAEAALADATRAERAAEAALAQAREQLIRAEAAVDTARRDAEAVATRIRERLECRPEETAALAEIDPDHPPDRDAAAMRLERLTRERDAMGPVNLRAETELAELSTQIEALTAEQDDLVAAIGRLKGAITQLSREGRERLLAAFERVNGHFEALFVRLFGGGRAHLELTNTEDPFAAGLDILASPPGKKLQTLSLLSGGEQALTALALIFAVFLTNPSPVSVLDEVDAPLDDANVDRFCTLLQEIATQSGTRFLVVTHHRLTMARMDRLYGVTMMERGVSQLVSVDLRKAEALVES